MTGDLLSQVTRGNYESALREAEGDGLSRINHGTKEGNFSAKKEVGGRILIHPLCPSAVTMLSRNSRPHKRRVYTYGDQGIVVMHLPCASSKCAAKSE